VDTVKLKYPFAQQVYDTYCHSPEAVVKLQRQGMGILERPTHSALALPQRAFRRPWQRPGDPKAQPAEGRPCCERSSPENPRPWDLDCGFRRNRPGLLFLQHWHTAPPFG